MNQLVLIADGNTQRGRRVVDACTQAGIPCKAAPHGAAALEMALSERPGLVVAQVDLPLVDALKLSEILRANPRTRGAGFLFLGEQSGLAGRRRVGDVLLPACSRPDEILGVVQGLIERQHRIHRLGSVAETGGIVEGELEQLQPSDLIELFYSNRQSGQLELTRTAEDGRDDRGRIELRDGEVIQAEVGSVDREKALFRLLTWRQGRFRFRPGRNDRAPGILAPTRAVLAEGMRQLEEWDRLALQLPPMDAQVKLRVKSAELPNIVHPLTQEVLLLLELYSRVGDVVDHCVFPDYQVLRTLHTLAEREIVQILRARPALATSPGEGLFNEAQARRLRDWLREGGAGRDAKLLVVSSDASATPDFANLLLRAQGVELSPEMARGPLGAEDLAPLARVTVDDDLGIELIQLPLSERFAPVWPLAGQGALGTLFLLRGPMAESSERVRQVSEALGRLPRARTFHVILLQQGERVSPEELRDNLSLIDEASLFLLPVDSPKEPTASLRRLFSRVVP